MRSAWLIISIACCLLAANVHAILRFPSATSSSTGAMTFSSTGASTGVNRVNQAVSSSSTGASMQGTNGDKPVPSSSSTGAAGATTATTPPSVCNCTAPWLPSSLVRLVVSQYPGASSYVDLTVTLNDQTTTVYPG